MQFLIDFAEEDPEFQAILARASNYAVVQGVVIDIDRLWLHLWATQGRRSGDRLRRLLRYYPDFDLFEYGDGGFLDPFIPSQPLSRQDIETWRPDDWEWLAEDSGRLFKRWPLVVKVCLRPQAGPDERIPTAAELYDGDGRLQVEVEVRPRARLASNPRRAYSPLLGGVSIGTGAADFGTLGVILTDAGGKHYGLTCSHVVAQGTAVTQPALRDMRSAGIIGTSILSSVLTGCAQGTRCNPWSGITANEIDAALIDMDGSVTPSVLEILDIGHLTGITSRAALTTGQTVEVMGRTSGLNSLRLGGLAAWYSFDHHGQDYCFRNLFEVESPYGRPGAIRQGDSGASVCAPGPAGTEWAGLIAGHDAFKGYAIYAESIAQWLAANGYRLQLR
ncbi:hypothetical protein [Sphingomonas endophytica]|uniref:Uncharacterized protein n=1 Tax=Sphingomonas endophytica TaxID=869719 RepID=A0A147I2U2_9SPHN|nr:hypothetical protein [Sphingomonas endophytica]KTT72249.1 hypothetical protein NS334_09450 [Sphingomonas endophytica]